MKDHIKTTLIIATILLMLITLVGIVLSIQKITLKETKIIKESEISYKIIKESNTYSSYSNCCENNKKDKQIIPSAQQISGNKLPN